MTLTICNPSGILYTVMTKRLTLRQKAFCKALVRNKFQQRKAYQRVYPSVRDNIADVSASKLVSQAKIKAYILNLMDATPDINLSDLITSFKDDVNAVKPLVTKDDHRITYVPDNSTRLEAKKVLLKAYGITSDKHTANIDARSVHVNITPADAQALKGIADNLRALNATLLDKRGDYAEPDL